MRVLAFLIVLLLPPHSALADEWLSTTEGCRIRYAQGQFFPQQGDFDSVSWTGACNGENESASGSGKQIFLRNGSSVAMYDGDMKDGLRNGFGVVVIGPGKAACLWRDNRVASRVSIEHDGHKLSCGLQGSSLIDCESMDNRFGSGRSKAQIEMWARYATGVIRDTKEALQDYAHTEQTAPPICKENRSTCEAHCFRTDQCIQDCYSAFLQCVERLK